MTVTIRQATPADASSIQTLYEELTGRACEVRPERIAHVAADDNNFLFVAERDARVVGTALVTLCLDVMYAAQPFAVLENIAVASSARNAGVGTALMRHMEGHCLRHDCSKIMLLSGTERIEAHRFFARLGYETDRKAGFVKYRSRLVAESQ